MKKMRSLLFIILYIAASDVAADEEERLQSIIKDLIQQEIGNFKDEILEAISTLSNNVHNNMEEMFVNMSHKIDSITLAEKDQDSSNADIIVHRDSSKGIIGDVIGVLNHTVNNDGPTVMMYKKAAKGYAFSKFLGIQQTTVVEEEFEKTYPCKALQRNLNLDIHCITILATRSMSWEEHNNYCLYLGGRRLLEVTEDSLPLLQHYLKRIDEFEVWIGGRKDEEGRFKWPSGRDVSMSWGWSFGEPSNTGGDQNCMTISHHGGGNFNDENCNKEIYHSLCEMFPATNEISSKDLENTVHSGMTEEEFEHTTPMGSCEDVMYLEKKNNWENAFNLCRNKGGHFFIPRSISDKDCLTKMLSNKGIKEAEVWIGLHDRGADPLVEDDSVEDSQKGLGTWLWMDGTVVTDVFGYDVKDLEHLTKSQGHDKDNEDCAMIKYHKDGQQELKFTKCSHMADGVFCDIKADVIWTEKYNACIPNNTYNQLHDISTIEMCKEKCYEENAFVCRSVQYNRDDKKCNLNTLTENSPNFQKPCQIAGVLFSVMLSSCGGEFNSNFGYIQHPLSGPYSGDNYQNNQRCVWIIRASASVKNLNISIVTYGTEEGADYLSIRDGESINSNVLSKITGEQEYHSIKIQTNTNVAHVLFTSDESGTSRGIWVTWEPSACGGEHNSSSGMIRYPDCSDCVISNFENCTWIIRASSHITITFVRIDIEENNDYLSVRDGDSIESYVFGKFSGNIAPNQIQTSTNAAHLFFTQREKYGRNNRYGFELHWKPSDPCMESFFNLDGQCIKHITKEGSWDTHHAECLNLGGSQLLEITEEKLHLLQPYLKRIYDPNTGLERDSVIMDSNTETDTSHTTKVDFVVWIGGRKNEDGRFKWPSGRDVSLSWGWSSEEPNNVGGNEDCMALVLGETFKDSSCSSPLGHSLCEMLPYSHLSKELGTTRTIKNKMSHCGKEYITTSGTIRHPLNGGSYQNNERCTWIIRAGGYITITFSSFVMEEGFDYLFIRNGESLESPLIGNFTGDNVTSTVYSSTNVVHVLFTSDYSYTGLGFELNWKPTDRCIEPFSNIAGQCIKLISKNGTWHTHLAECLELGGSHLLEIREEKINGVDHYMELQGLKLLMWSEATNACIRTNTDRRYSRHSEQLRHISTMDICKQKCTEKTYFECKSIDYNTANGECNINAQTSTSDYYSKPCPDDGILFSEMISGFDAWIGGKRNKEGTFKWPSGRDVSLSHGWEQEEPDNALGYEDCMTCTSSGINLADVACGKDYGYSWCEMLPYDHIPILSNSTLRSMSEKELEQTGCGGEYNSSRGMIRYPMHGDNYKNNEHCIWIIRAAYPINIRFVSFDTEVTHDSLYVRNGESMESQVLHQFSGNNVLIPIQTTTISTHLLFTSNYRNTRSGFELHWGPSSDSGCGGEYDSSSGTIRHPLTERNYQGYEHCIWKINTADPLITFSFFDTNEADFLYVLDGESSDSHVLHKYSGYSGSSYKRPDPVQIITTTTHLIFSSGYVYSSDYEDRTGFELHWEPAACGGRYTSSSGVIRHPLSGGNYESNEHCSWIIMAENPINLTFVSFKTGYYGDYLYIRDGDKIDSELLGTFSGSTVPSPIYTSTNAAYLLFTSNYYTEDTGFEIHWEPAATCSSEEFRCNNGLCINIIYVNDGDNDCGDESDENYDVYITTEDYQFG